MLDINKVHEIKDKLNLWNKDFLDNMGQTLYDIIFLGGTPEERAVIGSGCMVLTHQGINFQLPSTKEVFEWDGGEKVWLDCWEDGEEERLLLDQEWLTLNKSNKSWQWILRCIIGQETEG